ncbi:aldo/keto reductase [Mesorhizobium sp. NBSH29]|uniref:aldo/keto reductase n=1 Tax=Mesorhizobium sp. NBSH29 TaxID=2654249 RepID=UPI0018968412|nr:aldo/keto reductase [Mesorhizobium sp. NBSH29]QPC87489.1 aldo/keto reductase [Mesorhizobium sp. NBSH29]
MHSVAANGAEIPALGLGTWTLTGKGCTDLVREALSVGYRHIDTARAYDNEEAVGAGLRASGTPREKIFVTTKIWYTDLAPADAVQSAEGSLKRLGLDYVDLLLIHWPNAKIPLAGTMEALNRLRERGLTRYIGVANFPTATLAEAIKLSDAPLVANQVEYHPYLDQTKLMAACRKAGIAFVSYCPLYRDGGLLREPAVMDAASRHRRTPGQVILRWHVQHQGVVAIPRTSRIERLAENAALFDFELSQAEMASITALAERNSRICDYGFSPKWD